MHYKICYFNYCIRIILNKFTNDKCFIKRFFTCFNHFLTNNMFYKCLNDKHFFNINWIPASMYYWILCCFLLLFVKIKNVTLVNLYIWCSQQWWWFHLWGWIFLTIDCIEATQRFGFLFNIIKCFILFFYQLMFSC